MITTPHSTRPGPDKEFSPLQVGEGSLHTLLATYSHCLAPLSVMHGEKDSTVWNAGRQCGICTSAKPSSNAAIILTV